MTTGSHQKYWAPYITALTTTVLLPSCFLSTQEVVFACGGGGRDREVVSGKREGTRGHSLPLRQPGARILGRDRGPHKGHQRQNTRGAEKDGLGGAGPPVDKHTLWPVQETSMCDRAL